MLRDILDRIKLPDTSMAPGAQRNQKLPQRGEIPGTEIAIERDEQGRYLKEYLFSKDTVAALPSYYSDVQLLPPRPEIKHPNFYYFYTSTPGDLLPYKWANQLLEWSKSHLYLEQTLWQWIGLVILMFVLVGTDFAFPSQTLYLSQDTYKGLSTTPQPSG